MLRHEHVMFVAATLGGLVHAVDEVFVAHEAYRAIPVAVLSIAMAAFYRRVPQTVRGAAALIFGLFWLGGIFTHWIPLARDGAEPGDWTSFVSVPAGALFAALGTSLLIERGRHAPAAN